MNSREIFFNLNPVNFFIISGLLQNFIVAGILFFRKADRPFANKLLSITIIIVNLHLTYLMVLDTNLDNLFPSSLWLPYSYLTATGPLIYFYTQSLTDRNFNRRNIKILHFAPVIIEVLLQAIQILYSIQNHQLYYNTPLYFYFTPILYIWSAASILYYLKLSLTSINNYEAWAVKNFSNLKEITLVWLKKLIVYYRLFWIIWVPFVSVFLFFFKFQLQYPAIVLILYLLMLALTYLTFWIGLEGIGHVNFIPFKQDEGKGENKNYSKLTEQEIQTYVQKASQLMTVERLYLNETLCLRDFASHMNADPNLISFILNNHLNHNFYDFVNSFRIEEVKTRLGDPSYKHLTLLGIALESGFNSKTTFNRVFKQVTGVTPSQFQQKEEH